MVTMTSARRSARGAKPQQRQIVSTGFIAAVAALTAGLVALVVPYLDNPVQWLVLAFSVPPIFTTLYHRLMFVKGWLLHRQDLAAPPRREATGTALPGLAFIIASCKEPFEVAKMTFDCAYAARYSGTREIIVVDNTPDTDDADFRLWKSYVESHSGQDAGVRVVFRHNSDTAGKKPGNIDLAQRLIADSEYVVFLDIDSSLPLEADLLDIAASRFESDPRLGVLQFHTVPTNNHFNRLSRAVAVAQHALRISYLTRARGGFAMFYGHNAMWRRALLDANGSWLEHYRDNVIVTEDLLKTLGVYANGYTFEYLNVPTGEWVPSSLSALDSMWMRWTYGGFQVLVKYLRHILTARGLSATQRVDLATMLVGYGTTPMVLPLAFVWFAVLPTSAAAILTSVVMWLPTVLCAVIMWRQHNSGQDLPLLKRLGDLYGGMFLVEAFILAVQIRAALNVVAGKKQGWRVTAKCSEDKPRALGVLLDNRFVVMLSTLTIVALVGVWGYRHGFSLDALMDHAVLAMIPVDLLMCVVLYGGEVQSADEEVMAAVIDPGPIQRRVHA